jgi:hypothetical protein
VSILKSFNNFNIIFHLHFNPYSVAMNASHWVGDCRADIGFFHGCHQWINGQYELEHGQLRL